MRYRIGCLPVVSTLVLGTAISAQAQWMPVVAKQKELTYRLEENGSRVIVSERRGAYKRSSSGSVMHTWRPIVDGQEVGSVKATFLDASTGERYAIDHGSQRARLIHQTPAPILPETVNPEETVGEAVINGVACAGLKVLVNGKPTKGVNWVSVPYDLDVKREFPTLNGRWIVQELYDIQFVEPERSVFAIPQNYERSRR